MRNFLLNILHPFIRLVGLNHLPYTKKRINEADVRTILSMIEEGDILLGTRFGEYSNLLIPGDYKHGAIYSPHESNLPMVEAVDPEVRDIGIYDFLMSRDRVALVRPKLPKEKREFAARMARTVIGLKYDYDFKIPRGKNKKNEKMYCFELVYWCYLAAVGENWDFTLRDVMGVPTVKGDDFIKASKHFEVLYEV